MNAGPEGGARPGWLESEAVIAGRLLVLGLAAGAAIWLALRVPLVTAAVTLGVAEVAMLWPLARWLRRRHVPAALAAIGCVALFSSLFVAVFVVVGVQLVLSWPELAASFTDGLQSLENWLQSDPLGIDTATLQTAVDQLQVSLGSVLARVAAAAATAAGAVSNLLTILVVATFFSIFALTSGDKLWSGFLASLDVRHRPAAAAAFPAAMRTAGSWFYASTVTGLIDGLLIGLGLFVLDVPLALPIAALTFLMAHVPLVGATLAGALAVLVALASGGPGTAAWALGVVLVVQQVEGNVLSPLLLSKALNFHPVITLLLTTTAGLAFGLVGLFLAVPIAGMVVSGTRAWRAARKPGATGAA